MLTMKEKIKSKFIDAIATFFGSLMALGLSHKFMPIFTSYFNYLKWEPTRIEKAEGIVFAFFVAVGFIIVLAFFGIIKWIWESITFPKVKVSFFNQKDKKIQELDFRDSPEEPQYLKICFDAKFTKIQLWFLKRILNAKIVIRLNPQMCAIELAEGFIANNEDFYLENGSITFDIFSKYSSSSEYSSIYLQLNLLLVQAARGEIKLELDLSKSPFLSKYLFINYCKFQLEQFTIQG